MNGQWGEWTAWTACDKTSCGHQSRERKCDSPPPSFKGDPCDGEATETQWCNTDPCEGMYIKNSILLFPKPGYRYFSQNIQMYLHLTLLVPLDRRA